ncbi:hypothetical protein [Gayadomonas joobiniege]|uniref:hypothetical protein n=1 Tax=Gayadomonas joobiniege TaxID=1234606 RepID=UPI0003818D44|nr:hypothetical protein [Gayadomonas joobiniege]
MNKRTLINPVINLAVGFVIAGCTATSNLTMADKGDKIKLPAAEFNIQNGTDKQFYFDKYRKALAINAGNPKLRDVYISASKTLDKSFPTGHYRIHLSTITEVDGESSYRFYKNNELLATVFNPPTKLEFEKVHHDLGRFNLAPGDIVKVSANAVTNGKIPEGDITAYARGRWVSLTLTAE